MGFVASCRSKLGRFAVVSRAVGERSWRRRRGSDYVLAALLAECSKGDVVVDVGGDGGIYALALASTVGRRGMVLSFEPNPRSFADLRRRTWRTKVHPFNLALSSEAGTATLSVSTESAGLGTLVARPGLEGVTFDIQTTTLDDISAKLSRTINVIKVDVEGWEREVLAGATKTITRARPILFLEIEDRHLHGRGYSSGDVAALVCDMGYEALAVTPNGLQSVAPSSIPALQAKSGPASSDYINNFVFRPIA